MPVQFGSKIYIRNSKFKLDKANIYWHAHHHKLDFQFQFPFQNFIKDGLKLQSVYTCFIDFYKIALTFIVESRESTSSNE